jgi:rhodanese-related sulfurtransferase
MWHSVISPEKALKKVISYLIVFIQLFVTLHGVQAAEADAAKQPSTQRVISHADMKKTLEKSDGVIILDLRRDADYDKDTLTMPAARRLHPDKIAEWSGTLPKDKEILLYCAHGGSISNASVDYLTKNGYKARLIAGGFDGWKDAGGATVAKPR